MSYRNLEVWQLARGLSIMVHRMTLEQLPKFEMYEEGSQIRRSSKSIRANIVEGYGRRVYKQEFIKHLTYALASCDETMDHLETLMETGSLKDKALYETIREQTDMTGRKLNQFRKSVESGHKSSR
jgi:four helix bundle protein